MLDADEDVRAYGLLIAGVLLRAIDDVIGSRTASEADRDDARRFLRGSWALDLAEALGLDERRLMLLVRRRAAEQKPRRTSQRARET